MISHPIPSLRKISLIFFSVYSQLPASSDYSYSYLCTYDLYSRVHNVLDASISIMRASGRGLDPGNQEFFGAQKIQDFQGATPTPPAQVMDMHASKTFCTGLYKIIGA
jgi:hypothetical protein